jgi:hypothetical protein
MSNWTAKAPDGVKSWDRIRFFANEDDYRSVIWPPLGPYWCSGYGDDHSVVVAYLPHGTTDKDLKKYWPEARDIDRMQEDVQISFSDRFSKPDWWIE